MASSTMACELLRYPGAYAAYWLYMFVAMSACTPRSLSWLA